MQFEQCYIYIEFNLDYFNLSQKVRAFLIYFGVDILDLPIPASYEETSTNVTDPNGAQTHDIQVEFWDRHLYIYVKCIAAFKNKVLTIPL